MASTKDLFNMGAGKKHKKESITPHKIAIAILIRQFCLVKESGTPAKFVPLRNDLVKPIHRRDFNIMVLRLIQGPDLSLEELQAMLLSGRYAIEKRFITEFDTSLKDLYVIGVGYLLDLVEYISRLTVDTQFSGVWCQINKNSILGCYLRRLMVFFEKLSFSQVIELYEAYKVYYNPEEKEVDVRKKYLDSICTDKQSETEIDNTHPGAWFIDENQWSRRQAELFIATQAALLLSDEQSALSPKALNEKIHDLLKSNPDLAEAHFLNYLNYLRVKEFCGAIDSLYHSFDRNTPIIDSKNNTFEEKSRGFRYAALNLAILHAQFGHREEAMAALKESIMMAQVANDNVCLQHSLTWMYKLAKPANKKILIEHSVIKSMDMNLTYITSLGMQSYTQHAGLSGGNPKHIFENMIKCDVYNCQLSYRDLMSNSYAQKAALWNLYGKTEMSSLWSQLLLYLNTDNLTLGRPYIGEGMCQAMCNVANNFLLEGDYNLAQTVLKQARRTFPTEPNSHNWMLCEQIHTFTRALYNGDWSAAESAANQMANIDKWESCLRFAELNYTKGDFKSALNCIDHIIVDNVQKAFECKLAINIRIRGMIFLAEVHCASISLNNVPTSVITILNSALSLANLYHQDLLASIIRLHLANVQLLLGMPSQALKILDKELVHVLTHAGVFDRARAMLLYVKCLVADAGINPTVDRYKILLEATEMLKSVKEDFHKVEAYSRARDVLYLQAQLYNELQHFEDRNNCAFEYKQYIDEFPTTNSRTLVTSL